MPFSTSSIPPIINIGPTYAGFPYQQPGYSYGVNDSGAWQRFIGQGIQADVDLAAQWFLLQGWNYTVTYVRAGIAKVEADAGWSGGTTYVNETALNIWEMDPQETDKALLSADFQFNTSGQNLSGLNSLVLETAPTISPPCGGSAATRLAIQAAVAAQNVQWNPRDPEDAEYPSLYINPYTSNAVNYWFDDGKDDDPDDGYDATNIALPSADYAAAYSLYKIMAAGVQQFPVDAPIIKHTQMYSNLYQTMTAYSNVGRVISASSMSSIEGASASLFFAMPVEPALGQFIETIGDLQYGWRKLYPSVVRIANYKWKTVNNYQFGLWPVRLFGQPL